MAFFAQKATSIVAFPLENCRYNSFDVVCLRKVIFIFHLKPYQNCANGTAEHFSAYSWDTAGNPALLVEVERMRKLWQVKENG